MIRNSHTRQIKRRGAINRASTQKAFTLIELIIVITIIAILAVLIVSGYASAYRKARLDMGTDILVSALKNEMTKVKSGYKTNAGDGIEVGCLGLRIPLDNTEKIQFIKAPFRDDPEKCDLTKMPNPEEFVDLPPQLKIRKITIGKPEESDFSAISSNLEVLFYPPTGGIKLVMDGAQIFDLEKQAEIQISYGYESNPVYNKTILIQPATGRIESE